MQIDELLSALAILKEFLEQQQQQPNKSQQTAEKGSRSYEVIDENTSAGEIAADARKEEHRRGEEQIQPEFNPTGW